MPLSKEQLKRLAAIGYVYPWSGEPVLALLDRAEAAESRVRELESIIAHARTQTADGTDAAARLDEGRRDLKSCAGCLRGLPAFELQGFLWHFDADYILACCSDHGAKKSEY